MRFNFLRINLDWITKCLGFSCARELDISRRMRVDDLCDGITSFRQQSVSLCLQINDVAWSIFFLVLTAPSSISLLVSICFSKSLCSCCSTSWHASNFLWALSSSNWAVCSLASASRSRKAHTAERIRWSAWSLSAARRLRARALHADAPLSHVDFPPHGGPHRPRCFDHCRCAFVRGL